MNHYRLDKPIPGVFAEGGDEYGCRVTVGRGDLLPASVQGQGLDAKERLRNNFVASLLSPAAQRIAGERTMVRGQKKSRSYF